MSDRRLLVLGGTSGIGEEIATTLRDTDLGIFETVKAVGYEDFSVWYRGALRACVQSLQPTDVIYSIGINRLDWIKDIKTADFTDVMTTNVYGFLNLIRVLDEESDGRPMNVVVITSDAAWRPMRTSAVYCASKAALEMCIRVASREYAPKGWRINGVAPGKVADTPMTEYVDSRVLQLRGWSVEAAEAYELQSTPLGRKVTKLEVAEVVAGVLFGPKAQTGEVVAVNGGR